MMVISNFVIRYIFRVDTEEVDLVFDKVDLDNYVRERTDAFSPKPEEEVDTEIQIFKNALEFNERKAREFMIPRTEIIAMELNEGLAKLRQNFIESGLSKILIYKDSIDNIIGYTHSFELFKKPADIKSILRPVSFIPESMAANEILNLLILERRSIAVVLDEFGGTSGLVTTEDIVEELFGEIDDEHDTEDLLEEKLGKGNYLFSARQEIDFLNTKYDLDLPESENYSTLGGLIISYLESIPEKGEKLHLSPYTLTMDEVSDSKIERVHIRVSDD
jgi:CBS domain containing-hemolysin-like protein